MNVSYVLKTKLTAKAFQEYLRNKKPRQLAGYAADCYNCTLARYIKHITGAKSVSVEDEIVIYSDHALYTRQAPIWIRNFIYLHDLNREDGKKVNVSTARRIASVASQYAYRSIDLFTVNVERVREKYKDQEKEWERLGTL